MLDQDLKNIRNYILTQNNYFSEGFYSSYMDEETGHIFAERDNGDKLPVFPRDQDGNYFYLRSDEKYNLISDNRFNISACQRNGVLGNGTVYLVAVLKEGDKDKLLSNLISTMGKYGIDKVAMVSAETNRQLILLREMQYADEKDKAAALQRLGERVIVSLQLTMITEVFFDCIVNPCKEC